MEGSGSSGRGEDGESVTEEPDEAWVVQHLEVTRFGDEHGGGVAVKVASLAEESADADVDVAKTGAWLQAHGGEVKAFRALMSACGCAVCTVCVCCARVKRSRWMFGCRGCCLGRVCAELGLGSRLHKMARGLGACTTLTRLKLQGMCLALPCCRVLSCGEQAPPFWGLVLVATSVLGTQGRSCCAFLRCTVVLFVLMRGIVWYGVHGIRQTAT